MTFREICPIGSSKVGGEWGDGFQIGNEFHNPKEFA